MSFFYNVQTMLFTFREKERPIMPTSGTCPVWMRPPSVSGWNHPPLMQEHHLVMPFKERITSCFCLITRTLTYVLVVKRSKLYTINGVFLWKKNSRLIGEDNELLLINYDNFKLLVGLWWREVSCIQLVFFLGRTRLRLRPSPLLTVFLLL